jgi:hypothetical protein
MFKIVQKEPETQADAATLNVQLLRSKYAVDVAEALYRAHKLSSHARLTDVPPTENRIHFYQIADAAVMLCVDEELREAAELYAAEALFGPLSALPAAQRVNKVRDMAQAIRAFLRFLRGTYPAALEHYRHRVRNDRAAMKAAQL